MSVIAVLERNRKQANIARQSDRAETKTRMKKQQLLYNWHYLSDYAKRSLFIAYKLWV